MRQLFARCVPEESNCYCSAEKLLESLKITCSVCDSLVHWLVTVKSKKAWCFRRLALLHERRAVVCWVNGNVSKWMLLVKSSTSEEKHQRANAQAWGRLSWADATVRGLIVDGEGAARYCSIKSVEKEKKKGFTRKNRCVVSALSSFLSRLLVNCAPVRPPSHRWRPLFVKLVQNTDAPCSVLVRSSGVH